MIMGIHYNIRPASAKSLRQRRRARPRIDYRQRCLVIDQYGRAPRKLARICGVYHLYVFKIHSEVILPARSIDHAGRSSLFRGRVAAVRTPAGETGAMRGAVVCFFFAESWRRTSFFRSTAKAPPHEPHTQARPCPFFPGMAGPPRSQPFSREAIVDTGHLPRFVLSW